MPTCLSPRLPPPAPRIQPTRLHYIAGETCIVLYKTTVRRLLQIYVAPYGTARCFAGVGVGCFSFAIVSRQKVSCVVYWPDIIEPPACGHCSHNNMTFCQRVPHSGSRDRFPQGMVLSAIHVFILVIDLIRWRLPLTRTEHDSSD